MEYAQKDLPIEYSYVSGESDKAINAHRCSNRKFPFCVAVSVKEGEYYVEVNGKRYVAKKGETVFVPSFVPHNVGMEDAGKISFAHFSCFCLFMDLLYLDRRDCFISQNSACIELIDELNACNRTESFNKKLCTDKAIAELLLELERENKISLAYPSFDLGILRAVNYVHTHIYESLSVDDIIAQSGYQRTAFYRIFKQEIHMTPQQYIEREKFKVVIMLLMNNAKVAQAAKAVGFHDETYFYKRFKQLFGISPIRYIQASTNMMNGADDHNDSEKGQ